MLWDDEAHITRADLQGAPGLRRIWFEVGATQQYYPLTHSVFWLEHRLWGSQTTGYHLVNVVLHGFAALVVVAALRRMAVPGAALAGAIFALHPVHVESVAWISELKNVLSGFFYLAAALVYLRYDSDRRRSTYLAALFLFVLALLSKTVTATLPGALLVVCWWMRGTIGWRRDVVPLLPFVALGAAAGLLTAWVEHSLIGARGADFDWSPTERVLIAGRAIAFYAGKLLWPVNLSFNYPRWAVDATDWTQYLYPLGVGLVAAAALAIRRRSRAPLAVVLIFCGTLFPVLGLFNVYPFRYAFVADHFQYLAGIPVIAGISALIALGIARAPKAAAALPIALVAVLAGLTWRQSRAYADVETLYAHTIARNPASWLAHHNLGMLKLSSSPAEALEHLREAARVRPDDAQTRVNFGYALQLAGRSDEALHEYRTALALDAAFAEAHNNVCSVLAQTGRAVEAVEACAAALRIEPGYAKAHFNMGVALARAGRAGSIEALREARRLDPRSFDRRALAELHNTLGAGLQHESRPEQAALHFEEALRLEPAYDLAHFNLANSLQTLGRFEQSLPHYERVLARNPRDVAARINYGVALEHVGRLNDAIRQYRMALDLKPDSPEAQRNLGRARRRR